MGRKELEERYFRHRRKKVAELMEIRKDWTIADYKEWETGVAIPYENRVGVAFNVKTLPEWRSLMEEVLYHEYDINYIQECIDNESEEDNR